MSWDFPARHCGISLKAMPHLHEKIDFTVAIFVVDQGKVLLVHHRRLGRWLPIGGHIELDEDPEAAALRETLEESGVRVALDGVLRLEVTPGPTQNRIRVFFLAHPIDDAPPLCAPNEHSLEAGWFTLGEVERLPLRGQEVFEILSAVERGAPVHPLSLLQLEGARWS